MIWTVLFWIFVVCFAWIMIVGYGGLVRLALALFRLANYAEKMRMQPDERYVEDESLAPVTVILPRCADEEDMVAYIRHHLELDFPQYEVVAVVNGSKDDALRTLVDSFGLMTVDQPIKRSVPISVVRGVYRSPLFPHLTVVDKVPAGYYDDLNCGLNLSRYPVVVSVSPACWIHKDNLWRLVRPFMMKFDTLVVGGLPRFSDHFEGVFAQLQQTVLLQNYPAGLAVPGQNLLPLVPEGYGAFRKTAVIEMGGFAPKSSELDMAARLYAMQKTENDGVQLLSHAAYEMVPRKNLSGLWQNVKFSQKELQSALWSCRSMIFRPRYGRTGMWDVPLQFVKNIFGPILEVLGMVLSIVLFAVGVLSPIMFWTYWLSMIFLGMVVSLAAVISQQVEESEKYTMKRALQNIGCALLYPLGFRQILNVMRTFSLFTERQ